MKNRWHYTDITAMEPQSDLVEQLWMEACRYADRELELRCADVNPQSIAAVNTIRADIMDELMVDFKRQVDVTKMDIADHQRATNEMLSMARSLTPSRIAEELCSVQPLPPHLFSDVYQAFRERDLQLHNRESQNDSPTKE